MSSTNDPTDCNTRKRGFRHTCPRCGDTDTVQVSLTDVRELLCTSCDAAFTAAAVREILLDWKVILDWLETAPRLPGD